MGKLTHPYLLIAVTAVAATALAVPVAQKRARLAEVRRDQENVVSELIRTGNQAAYLRSRRHELLTHPAAVAEVAVEQYGFMWENRRAADAPEQSRLPHEQKVNVHIVETGWERLLGSGNYIWRIPVAAIGLCAALFGLLAVFRKKEAAGPGGGAERMAEGYDPPE